MARLGRRGLSLVFFGVLDLVYAWSIFDLDDDTRQGAFFRWTAAVAPLKFWAALWAGVGLCCLFYAMRRSDRVGYASAIFLKVLWGAVCLGGWLIGGAERGYVSAAFWLAAAAFAANQAGWPEHGDWRGPTWTPPPSPPPEP